MALTDETKTNAANDVIDIQIAGVQRQRFRINGDNNSIVELNTSDIGAIFRLEETYPKLHEELKRIAELDPESENFSDEMKKADKTMRDYMDYIFDYPVSAVCAKYGTMYDPYEGSFKFEHILDALSKLYENNLNAEYKKMNARIEKHTGKYTKSTKKSRK